MLGCHSALSLSTVTVWALSGALNLLQQPTGEPVVSTEAAHCASRSPRGRSSVWPLYGKANAPGVACRTACMYRGCALGHDAPGPCYRR